MKEIDGNSRNEPRRDFVDRFPEIVKFHKKGNVAKLDQMLETLPVADRDELIVSVRYQFKGTKSLSDFAKIKAAFQTGISMYQGMLARARANNCSRNMWTPFQCKGGRRIAGIRINHLAQDTWKLDRVRRSACMHGFEINWTTSVWPGVIVKERPWLLTNAIKMGYTKPPGTDKLGNVGAALAHVTLWEDLSTNYDLDLVWLVMEDNVLFKPESLAGMCITITAAGDFDVLNLSVLRPMGVKIDDTLGLLRVAKEPVKDPGLPNVWLSSYLITGRGAAKMLRCFQRANQNLAEVVIDRVVVQDCLHKDEDIAAFVVDHHRFFGHLETGGDARAQHNDVLDKGQDGDKRKPKA